MDDFNYGRIRQYYSQGNLGVTAPSQFVKDHGDLLFNLTEMMLRPVFPGTTAILAVYCKQRLSPKIDEIGLFHKNADSSTPMVIYNMMFLEFTFDLLRFASRREPEYFFEIFSKYENTFYGTSKNLSECSQKHNSDIVFSGIDEEMDLLKKTAVALLFSILHECTHAQDDLRSEIRDMFAGNAAFKESVGDFSDDNWTEVACDYNALYEILSHQCHVYEIINKSMSVFSDDIFAMALIMLYAKDLFHWLEYGLTGSVKTTNKSIDDIGRCICLDLPKRCQVLAYALQITKNTSNMSMGTLNIWKAHSYATELIGDFLRCLGEALHVLGKSSTETIEEQTDNQSVKQDVTEDEIWFRVSLMEKE